MAKVFDDRACKLGEGPLWHPLLEQLFWFDIMGKKLRTRTAQGAQEWQFDRHVSAAGWIGREALMIATDRDLIRFDIATGAQEHLIDLEADNPATRSNDGRADPWGGFWIGTMGLMAEPGQGTIYRYFRGELRALFPNISITNAISFSPDAGHAYFADTAPGKVWRQRLSEGDGWPVGEPEIYLDHGPDGPNPDGAVVDKDGNFWCAEWGSARVRGYNPSGQVLRDVPVPALQPSCPAFGGPDLRDLYVTSAQQGMSRAALEADPHAGQVFVIEGVAPGQAEHEVIL